MNPSRTIGYLLVVTLVLFAPLILLLYFKVDDEAPRDRPLTTRPFVPEEEPEPDPGPPPLEAAELVQRRKLAVEGRVFASDLAPVEEGVVQLGEGEETASLGVSGIFHFPAAERPRQLPLSVTVRGGPTVSFPFVLTGDEDPDEGFTPEKGVAAGMALPGRPERLRWACNLGPRTEGDATEKLSISPGAVLVEDWGKGARIQVHGTTTLPEGAHVYCNLNFDNFRVVGTLEPSEVRGGAWAVTLFAPEDVRLYAGRYEIVASFNSLAEPVARVDEWRRRQPDGTWDQTREVIGKRSIVIGDPADAEKEDRAVENYYRVAVAEANRLRQALTSRVKLILDEGKGWDPALLKARQQARRGWFSETFIDDDGMFRVGHWRRFLDEDWRPTVKRLLEKHRARTTKKYTEAESRLDGYLVALLDMSTVYSLLFVYPLFQLPPDPNDFYLDERGQQDLGLLEKIVEENVHHLQRFCRLVDN